MSKYLVTSGKGHTLIADDVEQLKDTLPDILDNVLDGQQGEHIQIRRIDSVTEFGKEEAE